MSRRLLITGAGGFLGSRICEYFNNREGYETLGVNHRELDIEDYVAVSAFIKTIHPDYVLHCAAVSNTGLCEKDPARSEKVNVRGTANLAKACRASGVRMIFTSSDQIYNASHSMEPNREGNESRPGSVYGKDKKRAEESMFTYLPDAVSLRLTWMYDVPSGGRVGSLGMLQKLVDALRERREVEFPVHEYRGITYVWEVVRHLEAAMTLPGGVYNFGSENRYNTFETARLFLDEIAGSHDMAASQPWQILRRNEERFASCPRNLIMNTDKARSHGINFSGTVEGFRRCCMEYRELAGARC